jgi:signal peptidase II
VVGKGKRYYIPLGIFLFGLFFDQLTKSLVQSGKWSFSTSWIQSTLTYNTGTLWSLFSGPQANTAFIFISVLVLSIVAVLFFKYPEYQLYFSLVFAGGLGNLIDRIRVGAVIDFINLGWWPIFNIADSMLMVGVILLLIQLVREEIVDMQIKSKKKSSAKKSVKKSSKK